MDPRNIVFVFIPKTGTTTIITQLSQIDPVLFPFHAPHRTAIQFRAIDPLYDSKFSFSIIRNPFQRLVSLWQHDIRAELGKKNMAYAKYHDFNTWILEQATHNEWHRSGWALPQWYWVSDSNKVIVTKLFRFEYYREGLNELSNIIGITLDSDMITNESMKKLHYKDIASPETKKIMLELCRLDCDKFNYDW